MDSFDLAGPRLWSPDPLRMGTPLRDATAACLATAFGSRAWSRTPMPLGPESDPHSALGILAQLDGRGRYLLASSTGAVSGDAVPGILGCVLGAVLDAELIDAFGLGEFGAKLGDGLLAYIGVPPAAQGLRLGRRSLASSMFAQWLELPSIARCPDVFIRTRSVITPILHLVEKHGFGFCGSFELDFHGERQERLVFRKRRRESSRPRMSPRPFAQPALART